MNAKINVLIFPSSGENAYEIYDSLKTCVNINVFGATSKMDYSRFLYKNQTLSIGNYNILDEGFYQNLNKIVELFGIDVIIPTHDTIAYQLVNNKDRVNAKILTADKETSYICRHKKETFKLFKDEDFCPKIYNDKEIPISYPVFAKPNIGAGAQGVKKIDSRDEFISFLSERDDYVVCEYLPGDEYTVDCFTNKNGRLLFVGVRTRERVTMGISFASKTLKCTEEIMDIANRINAKTKMLGAWFFQLKKDDQNKYKLLEISCRQAGTMNLYRNKGINFALCGIYEIMGKTTTFLENQYNLELERRIEAQYRFDYEYDKVYIDYDDTVVMNGEVLIDSIQFIYYCKNKNIKLYLISRHDLDHDNSLEEDLEFYNIDKNIFNDIIKLKKDEEKADFISNFRSIFIDNSFKEREKVYKKLGIPVFDVDAIKGLINFN